MVGLRRMVTNLSSTMGWNVIEGVTFMPWMSMILDGTPVLDIKPYVSQYDSYPAQQWGWLDSGRAQQGVLVADDRFEASR